MAVIPEGFGQANFRFIGSAVPLGAECTLGLEMPLPTPTPAEAAEVFYEAWQTRIQPFQVDQCNLFSVLMKFGPTETGVFFEFTGISEGGDDGEPDTPATAVLVRKLTVDGGRAGRGRMFVPGIRESRIEAGGHVNGTFRLDMQAGFDNFQSDIEDADYKLMVLHGEGSPLDEPSEVLSFSVDSTAATQRRRMRR